jgi:hypothetical protein
MMTAAGDAAADAGPRREERPRLRSADPAIANNPE